MNRELYVGFKGKNNASCILAKAISADSYLLTNSFEGLKRDIDSLSCAYDSVILFGIDKNLTDTVRIEAVAEKDTRLYSTLNIAALSAQLDVAGIHNCVSHEPTHYLCNAAYWHLLQKFNGKAVLIHIPSIKSINEHLIDRIKCGLSRNAAEGASL